MSARLTPVLAALLAAAWCLSQALDSGLLAAGVAAAALWAAAMLASHRRPGPTLALLVTALMLVVAGALVLPVLLPAPGARVLAVQLGLAGLLAPVVPALYAATFHQEPPGDDPMP